METLGFNPHPTRRPDATRGIVTAGGATSMFQSSSDPKAGCDDALRRDHSHHHSVSILIRPEGRMRHARSSCPSRRYGGFQSSSDPKAGCDRRRTRRRSRRRWCFNPHPTRRPDATLPNVPFQRSSALGARRDQPKCTFSPPFYSYFRLLWGFAYSTSPQIIAL